MATVFESISLAGLRKAHLEQLLYHIEMYDKIRIYYGPRQQFEKRHRELKQWAKEARDYAYSDGVVLPPKSIFLNENNCPNPKSCKYPVCQDNKVCPYHPILNNH